MAQRLNLLFQNAPRQYLERTVLFTDELSTPESLALLRHRTLHHLDLQPLKERSTVRVLRGLHEYQDMPLTSYFALPGTTTLIPKNDGPARFVLFPDFTRCRLLVHADGDDWLKLSVEEGLAGSLPAAENAPGSRYLDSFGYWDYTYGELVGRIRGTAVLVKEAGEPWTIFLQQIVGTPGFEVVRILFSRALRSPQ